MSTGGPRWLLLHGTPLTPHLWHKVAARLERHGQVFCPTVEPTGGAVTQRDLAAALIARLPPGGPVHVVGHSFGGQVAIEFALAAPELTRSLTVLCSRDTPFPLFHGSARRVRSGQDTDIEAAITRWFRPQEIAAGVPIVDYARRCLQQADRARWSAALDAIAQFDRSADVHAIGAPTTLIAAEHDPVSTPAAMAALAARVPARACLP